MKITLKRTPEQVELVKAMASKNREVAYEAQMALAEFIGPVLAKVINQAPTLSNMFTPFQFNEDDSPSLPLDLYYDITAADYIKVYSTSVPGGLPTNTVTPLQSEMKFTTYRLDSAVDFDKRYAARSRLDVVSKSFTRLAQEVLLKQENTSASLVLGSLADADTNGKKHVIQGGSTSVLLLDDFNRLLTLAKRINTAWTGGTPEARIKGITDLIVSPEIVESLRAMAYNPINSAAAKGIAVSSQAGAWVPATDSMREDIYRNAGIPEFYGIGITEYNELGTNQKFNKLFAKLGGTDGGTGSFDATADELCIGVDRSRESMLRAIATDSETGAEFRLLPDDQYSVRQSKIGYYGALEEGRMVIDTRVLTGIVINAS